MCGLSCSVHPKKKKKSNPRHRLCTVDVTAVTEQNETAGARLQLRESRSKKIRKEKETPLLDICVRGLL